MNRTVHLVISDTIFGGFEHYLPLTVDMVSLQDLITPIVAKLNETLAFHKMEDARILLQERHFHIHGSEFQDIINGDNNTIYVCHHDHD